MSFKARVLALVSGILILHTALFVFVTLERAGRRFGAEQANALSASVSAGRAAFLAARNELVTDLERLAVQSPEAEILREAASGARPREAHDVVQAAERLRPERLSVLRILDRSGAVLSASPGPERFGSQDRELASLMALGQSGPWVRSLTATGQPELSLVEIRRAGDALFYVGARTLDARFLRQVSAQAGARVLLEAGGMWLSEMGLEAPPSWAQRVAAAREAGETTVARAGRTIASVPLYDDTVLYVVREDRVLNELRASITRSALLVGAASLLVSWVLALWLTRGLSAPLRELTIATTRVAEGRLQEPIALSRSIREFAVLQSAFNDMQRELIRQRDALSRAERTAAWQDAARRLAHEIKNTLTPLQVGWEGMRSMAQGTSPWDPARVRVIADGVSHGISVLRHFLAEFTELARWPEPSLTPVDLGELAQTTAGLYAGQLGARIEVERHGACRVRADAGQVTRALANLIQNALDAAVQGAVVTVDVRRRGNDVRLSVEDNGPGMPPETLSRIFTPYFTTRADGTGLGLSIVERVAKAHGATVDVASTLGKGTTIALTFRALDEDHVTTRSDR